MKLGNKFYFERLAIGPYKRLSDEEKFEHDSKYEALLLHLKHFERLNLLDFRGDKKGSGATDYIATATCKLLISSITDEYINRR